MAVLVWPGSFLSPGSGHFGSRRRGLPGSGDRQMENGVAVGLLARRGAACSGGPELRPRARTMAWVVTIVTVLSGLDYVGAMRSGCVRSKHDTPKLTKLGWLAVSVGAWRLRPARHMGLLPP